MSLLPDLFEVLRNYFTNHGYWTLAITLLLENAGIPLPGETMLLFASFLAFQHHELNLGLIILVERFLALIQGCRLQRQSIKSSSKSDPKGGN